MNKLTDLEAFILQEVKDATLLLVKIITVVFIGIYILVVVSVREIKNTMIHERKIIEKKIDDSFKKMNKETFDNILFPYYTSRTKEEFLPD